MPTGFERMVNVGGFRLPPEMVEAIETTSEGQPAYIELYRVAYQSGYGDNIALLVAKYWEEFYGNFDFDESGEAISDSDGEGDPRPQMFGSARDVAYIPVPRNLLRKALRAVADLLEATGTVSTSRGGRAASSEAWTDTEIKRLREALKPGAARALLDLASKRPGEWLSLSEIKTASGRNQNQARADLASLTRLAKRDFKRSAGPFDWRWGVDGDKQAYYRVSEQDASAWLNEE
ncbi:MAG: hypothetical protein WEB00_12380 [Dehalococcoidia bacterium]